MDLGGTRWVEVVELDAWNWVGGIRWVELGYPPGVSSSIQIVCTHYDAPCNDLVEIQRQPISGIEFDHSSSYLFFQLMYIFDHILSN